MRQEGALPAKHQDDGRYKKKRTRNTNQQIEKVQHATTKTTGSFKGNYPPCKHCGKIGHAPFKCWRRLEAKCSKCNQFGHEAIICKNKTQQKDVDARVVMN